MSSVRSSNLAWDSRFPSGFHEIHFETLPSTNSWLKEEAVQGRVEFGTVVTADYQSSGKGRLGRTWNSEIGQGLTFSVLLKADLPQEKTALMSLMTALAIKNGLESYLGNVGVTQFDLGLRWPNDLMVNGRKLAGILCESGTTPAGIRFVVAGIGINVNQSEIDFAAGLRTPASSLYLLTGIVEDPRDILPYMVCGFDETCKKLRTIGERWIPKEWLLESGIYGRQVEVSDELGGRIIGVAKGLTDDGALMLDTIQGLKIIRSGDLTMV